LSGSCAWLIGTTDAAQGRKSIQSTEFDERIGLSFYSALFPQSILSNPSSKRFLLGFFSNICRGHPAMGALWVPGNRQAALYLPQSFLLTPLLDWYYLCHRLEHTR
jgi:hypothetical protein